MDHHLGWSHLVKKGLDVKVVPGSHINMLKEPQVKRLAEILVAELASAQVADQSAAWRDPKAQR
jgi:thioesterase domain-containing protein